MRVDRPTLLPAGTPKSPVAAALWRNRVRMSPRGEELPISASAVLTVPRVKH